MAFRHIITSMLLVGLFLVAIINFGVGLSSLNPNSNQSILDDSRISSVSKNLIANQTALQDSSNEQLSNFESENLVSIIGDLLFFTITKAGTTFTTVLKTFWAITGGLLFEVIFGGSAAFGVLFGTITTILLVTIIFLLWRTYKAGE